jgi:hypothetical protein
MRKGLTKPSWLAWLLIATILAFGAYLRVSGIQSDFPFLYDPDEPTFIGKAVRLLSRNSLDPGWYGHPGQFTIYLLALSYKALFFVSKITGTIQDFHSFLEGYQYDPTGFYYIGRLLSASFSVGVLILVALIARRLGSQWPTTALAVLLVSISPVLIAYGYLVRPDNQMTFFALIVCLFAIRITEEPRFAYYVYAGLALGVAVSCKYPAVVFAIAIIAAHTMVYRGCFWRRWYDVALSGAAAVVATFLTAPYLFLNPRGMMRDVLAEARPYHLSRTASGPLDSTFWYFDAVLQPSAGYVGVILFLIAAAAAAFRLAKGRGVLAITAIAFFFFIVNLNLHWMRWLIPFMPLYLLLAALGVQDIASWVANVSGRMSIAVAVGMALCVGVLAAPLQALWGELTDKRENSRTLAFNWIVANVPENSGILLEMYTPQLPGEKYKLWEVSPEGALVPLVSSRRFVLTGWTNVGALADLREIEVKDVDFIVLSSWYDRYKAERERYRDELARYDALMRKYPLIFQTGGVRVLRVK